MIAPRYRWPIFGVFVWLWLLAGPILIFTQETTAQAASSADSPPQHHAFFGQELFNLPPGAFDISAPGAVDPGYPIGPKDEIDISVWGQVELHYTLDVDSNGGINIPRVGRLQVAGIPLGQLQQRITRFLSRAYSGINENPDKATTFVDVSLGKLRTIRIFVAGEVRKPGAYTANATTTVLNALYQAGGPTDRGSMRNIRLVRHDQVAGGVDLYKFLLSGDKSENVRLQNGDVVYVPMADRRVRLDGQVRRPDLYELKAGEGLKRLIEIAGGLKPDAYAGHVQIERTDAHRERRLIDVDLAALNREKADFPLVDGDRVRVFRIRGALANAVTVRGYVVRPGRYQLLPGMTLKDLIEKSGGLLPETYRKRANVIRTNPNRTQTLVPIQLEKALAGDPTYNIPLAPLDTLIVYSIHTFGDRQFVTIDGRVRRPGRYELFSGMGLQDLIVTAGGLQDDADRLEVEIARSDPDASHASRQLQILRVKLDSTYAPVSNPADKYALEPGDVVFVRSNPDVEPRRYVALRGEVRFPGLYALGTGVDRLTEVLKRAGGLKADAYPQGIRFYRQGLGRVPVDLPAALKHPDGPQNIPLRDGDIVELPVRPSTVEVAGAVYQPGAVLFRPGKGLGYYLEHVGGLTGNARKNALYVVRANGEILKPGRLFFWHTSPGIDPGSRIVVPPKSGPPPGPGEAGTMPADIPVRPGAATTPPDTSRSISPDSIVLPR